MLLAPSRSAALLRLTSFLSQGLRDYAIQRNFDLGPAQRSNVSMLSPYVRHRLLSEWEMVDAALNRYASSTVDKFVQEVCWRTYFKGWLEQRPAIWQRYLDDLDQLHPKVEADSVLAEALHRALAGKTGIACFDAWASELVETGYLHNHARMWFASIWVFTLGLPWQLGADFFMRHLLDGDPASNTLSWRWISGLHTIGKTYLARPDNIVKYTRGRFGRSEALAATAPALPRDPMPPPAGLRTLRPIPSVGPLAVLLTEEDLTPESWEVPVQRVVAIIAVDTARAYRGASASVIAFKQAALRDALARARQHFGVPDASADLTCPDEIPHELARIRGASWVTSELPVGPARTAVDASLGVDQSGGPRLCEVRRRWDAAFWPHATGDFRKLETRIPSILHGLSLASMRESTLSYAQQPASAGSAKQVRRAS
jgi:deoxyribodipyrimidine photo-lyase